METPPRCRNTVGPPSRTPRRGPCRGRRARSRWGVPRAGACAAPAGGRERRTQAVPKPCTGVVHQVAQPLPLAKQCLQGVVHGEDGLALLSPAVEVVDTERHLGELPMGRVVLFSRGGIGGGHIQNGGHTRAETPGGRSDMADLQADGGQVLGGGDLGP